MKATSKLSCQLQQALGSDVHQFASDIAALDLPLSVIVPWALEQLFKDLADINRTTVAAIQARSEDFIG